MRKTLLAAAVAALTTAILGACSTGDPGDPPDGVNEADVSFATEMIPHHRQATEMAALAPDRSDDPAVLDLAERIEAAQAPEIDLMTGWLDDWAGDDRGSEMSGSMDSMPGMMSADQLTTLEASTGEAFDQMFLTMMVEHHEGAIEMARAEQTDGDFDDAVALAETIQREQAAEIDQMRAILGS